MKKKIKKTNKKAEKQEKKKKVIPMYVIIAILAILSITTTYAWISLQRRLEIMFFRVRIESTEDLQFSLDGENFTYSIDIEDMEQLYGTYNAELYQARNGQQTNYVPKRLNAVSTVGSLENGRLIFVQGQIKGNSLVNITKCSERDLTREATTEQKERNNASHPYLAFDMYLRNTSRMADGNPKELQLNLGSSVTAKTANTGLEGSARVGFVVYNNTTDVGASGETVRALTASNNDTVAIWEPNYKIHTNQTVELDSRITSTLQDFETYAVKDNLQGTGYSGGVTNDGLPMVIEDITNSRDSALTNVYTNKPNQEEITTADGKRTQTPDTTDALTLLQVDGRTPLTIQPNRITKVRVYVWLEGQDPDCVDLSTSGKELNVIIRLSVPTIV